MAQDSQEHRSTRELEEQIHLQETKKKVTQRENVTRGAEGSAKMCKSQGQCCVLTFTILLVLAALISVTVVILRQQKVDCREGFVHGAVAADSLVCSEIGRNILKEGGSPVDAAIAALLCTSVINPQSMGLGGGVIFTIYNASTGLVEVINARETVPQSSTLDLTQCNGIKSFFKTGAQWIGVPGELRGYEAAHRRHGRLPWKSLFQPTINLVAEGVKLSSVTSKFLKYPQIKNNILKHSVCTLLCKDQDLVKENQLLNFTQLAHTLRVVSEKGADAFYQGPIAELMLEDLQSQGSNLTRDDFTNYKVHIGRALNMSLANYTLYSAHPPSGGALLSFILKVLEGYNFSESSIQDKEAQIQTYHRIAETMKFTNGQKIKMADSGTKQMEELTTKLLSERFAQQIRDQIDDYGNHSLNYYSVNAPRSESFGTSHISVISQDGSSVSVTSSINQIFGSMVYSPQTGIIFNNQLADFCSGAKVISTGDRPPSSMAPSILLSNDKKSQLVIGASGGSYITSATALAIVNTLWFGANLEKAISDPILHVKEDNKLVFEHTFSKDVQEGLQNRGHQTDSPMFFNVVQGVQKKDTCLFAYSDKRKKGKAAGY
ncbi:glutathione hydrolase 5 proenzyme [Xenopus laevis]|uniref:Glutathione hydrolase 5 proenzyme n=2 Tax=Xenopus laevis TaxID=8355 RepID=A0A1L8I0B7_XENLA|nr:glutathione hydrolase 5 proenzyme [Xenopus laevis]OCU01823.1 hypothetical protein XELAEV_18007601mg [Xenopus laevis]